MLLCANQYSNRFINLWRTNDEFPGTCVGINIGKCNCLACVNGTICYNDNGCGGLEKACGRRSHKCNCERGEVPSTFTMKKHGLQGSYEEQMNSCSERYCVPNTPSCYGLPCNSGLCYC
ncbi:unnamed protein product [Enterobius vermicularis]|uniref:CC domain-containing protein n=1 Tax=Enterobius vermicularis TaxID=51028 RepID=A0A0N4UWR2_ENTVE|nr:unnamed protein product [Enterobius vermicularis]